MVGFRPASDILKNNESTGGSATVARQPNKPTALYCVSLTPRGFPGVAYELINWSPVRLE